MKRGIKPTDTDSSEDECDIFSSKRTPGSKFKCSSNVAREMEASVSKESSGSNTTEKPKEVSNLSMLVEVMQQLDEDDGTVVKKEGLSSPSSYYSGSHEDYSMSDNESNSSVSSSQCSGDSAEDQVADFIPPSQFKLKPLKDCKLKVPLTKSDTFDHENLSRIANEHVQDGTVSSKDSTVLSNAAPYVGLGKQSAIISLETGSGLNFKDIQEKVNTSNTGHVSVEVSLKNEEIGTQSDPPKLRASLTTITAIEIFEADYAADSNFVVEKKANEYCISFEKSVLQDRLLQSEEEAAKEFKRRDIPFYWAPAPDKNFNLQLSVDQQEKKEEPTISVQKVKGFDNKRIPVLLLDYTTSFKKRDEN